MTPQSPTAPRRRLRPRPGRPGARAPVDHGAPPGHTGPMLRHAKTGREAALRARTTFGRDAGNDVCLDEPGASGHHAVVQWLDHQWTVRDLASTNGTWVQEHRIAPGEDVPLALGVSVAFGDPRQRWWVMSADPPRVFAESLADGRRVDAIDGVLGLPSNDEPTVMLFPGARGWVVEDTEGTHPAHDRGIVVVDGTAWRIALPELLDDTAGMDPDATAARVRISGTLHQPHIEVCAPTGWIALRPASCDRLLWFLTREREADDVRDGEDRGLTHIDLVAEALGVDPRTIDVYVYRLRNRLGRRGIHDLIERRCGVGQLRLGFERLEFAPTVTGSPLPAEE